LIEGPEGDVVSLNALTVLSTTAMKTSFEALAPAFEREAGYRLAVTFGPSSQLEKRLAEGEAADVAIVTHAGAQDLIARGQGIAGSLADLARSFIGVCVAKSIALSKPVGGGASGAHMAAVFDRLDIGAAIANKAIYGAGGPSGLVGLIVERGEAEIGIQQMAELMAVPGIDIVGPLPDGVQSATQFTAFVPSAARELAAARVLIDYLRKPAAKAVIKAKGLDPN
jgi:molybdate transport system substrate-binding protein